MIVDFSLLDCNHPCRNEETCSLLNWRGETCTYMYVHIHVSVYVCACRGKCPEKNIESFTAGFIVVYDLPNTGIKKQT